MRKTLLLCFTLSVSFLIGAHDTNILFLGNSYTSVNNLPLMTIQVAQSLGLDFTTNENTPGGCTLEQHTLSNTSRHLIAQGTFQYVVLQEQSQMPAFPLAQVQDQVYPYAATLDSLIHQANPCATTLFYQTWGRKEGDQNNCPYYPPLCSYEGMDSLLEARYRYMAQHHQAVLVPVGNVWHYIYNQYPKIELYASDHSHPSIAGTFAAACCFVTIIAQTDPTNISFCPTGLDKQEADLIKQATKQVVFQNLHHYFVGTYQPKAQFSWQQHATQVDFTNHSIYAHQFSWDFGDNTTDTTAAPTHTYATPGSYLVTLIAQKCGTTDTISQTIHLFETSTTELSDSQSNVCIDNHLKKIIFYTPNCNYTIYNILGLICMNGQTTQAHEIIDLHSLKPGLYILQNATPLQKQQAISFLITK